MAEQVKPFEGKIYIAYVGDFGSFGSSAIQSNGRYIEARFGKGSVVSVFNYEDLDKRIADVQLAFRPKEVRAIIVITSGEINGVKKLAAFRQTQGLSDAMLVFWSRHDKGSFAKLLGHAQVGEGIVTHINAERFSLDKLAEELERLLAAQRKKAG